MHTLHTITVLAAAFMQFVHITHIEVLYMYRGLPTWQIVQLAHLASDIFIISLALYTKLDMVYYENDAMLHYYGSPLRHGML